jgi:hypothetical protein
MTDTNDTISNIRLMHRRRRFAMKIQQKLDRALESYVRINLTDWSPDMDEKARDKINATVRTMIKSARKDGGGDTELALMVAMNDRARLPADEMRDNAEHLMEAAAKTLPVYGWIESIPGAGALGLATILAETGSFDNYSNPAKVWKRLGYAPYDGCAGSTWRRDTWRPRKLEAEEWEEIGFSPQRYALMTQIVTWLVNKQVIGAAKTEDGQGRPNGRYGEVYYKRRAKTGVAHPDWTKAHSHRDALRITMKEFLKDLFNEWRNASGQGRVDAHAHDAGGDAAGHWLSDAQVGGARRKSSRRPSAVDAQDGSAASAAGPESDDAHAASARRTTSRRQHLSETQHALAASAAGPVLSDAHESDARRTP